MNQIALPLAWPADEQGDFLVVESNARAVRMLEHWATWPVRTAVLAGPPQSGRSLLGRIFAARSGATVIDDADRTEEDALFHAWNRAQEERRPLLLIAAALPPTWNVALPDLRSRLSASPSAEIGAPEDVLVAALYERGFARRHLDARADLITWLTARTERSHAAVMETIDRLDRAALAGRRRLTIPLARETLEGARTASNRSEAPS
ncbi:HdaA/DnaA family protein [Sphingomonas phyllosphaerae]|uniref:HdaA/DnaA family protein n=1 Tax=Sphingomonas phyllosphaerae TaxID=257003 RepID=UPI0003B59C0F|nr:chromosomal replication initiator protein DnaA [Sphingomonas phyllosphaerae]